MKFVKIITRLGDYFHTGFPGQSGDFERGQPHFAALFLRLISRNIKNYNKHFKNEDLYLYKLDYE